MNETVNTGDDATLRYAMYAIVCSSRYKNMILKLQESFMRTRWLPRNETIRVPASDLLTERQIVCFDTAPVINLNGFILTNPSDKFWQQWLKEYMNEYKADYLHGIRHLYKQSGAFRACLRNLFSGKVEDIFFIASNKADTHYQNNLFNVILREAHLLRHQYFTYTLEFQSFK